MISVILQTSSLRSMIGYRFMVHICIVDIINSITQVIAQAATMNSPEMNIDINSINGALFQGSWAADYPMILVIAVDRLLSVVAPFHVEKFFDARSSLLYIALCWIFGSFNFVACLSTQVHCLWDASLPSFGFYGHSSLANVLNFVDFYFAEVVLVSSAASYVAIFVFLFRKRRLVSTSHHEFPLLMNFLCIFGVTGISLYLWHRPASNSAIYRQLLQTIIVIRFGMPPLAALLINRPIRSRFFRLRQKGFVATSHSIPTHVNTPSRRFFAFRSVVHKSVPEAPNPIKF